MSDIWSFYEFSILLEADKTNFIFTPKKTIAKPTTSGETEAPEKTSPEVSPEAPQSGFAPKRNLSFDPLEKLGGRSTKIMGKGRERQAAKDMSDKEAAAQIQKAAQKSPFDALSTLNDINGNWDSSYWATMETLKKLGYNIPEVPMEDHPRWVPTHDGGWERGGWEKDEKTGKVTTNGGAKDGPYVILNGHGPYSVKVVNPRHAKLIAQAAFNKLSGGSEIESDAGISHSRTSKLRDIGFNDMDRKAGLEGEERQRASEMRPKIIAKKLGGKPGIGAYQDNKEFGGKSVGNHSLRSAPEKKEAPEMQSGPSEGEAREIEKQLSKHLKTLDQLSDPNIAGEDSEAWAKEAEKIQAWAKDILKYKAAQLKGTDIWDELKSIAEMQESKQWKDNEMNEWLKYTNILEHIYE